MEATMISLLTEVGFPVAVTFYLLHRIEGRLDLLIDIVDRLPEKIAVQTFQKKNMKDSKASTQVKAQ